MNAEVIEDRAAALARQRELNDQLAKDGWMKPRPEPQPPRPTRMPSDGADKFMLRLPDGVRDRIAASAKVSGRTMNAEIGYHVQRSMGHLPGASGIDLAAIPTADLLAELGRRCER
jgi:hypothetical protein